MSEPKEPTIAILQSFGHDLDDFLKLFLGKAAFMMLVRGLSHATTEPSEIKVEAELATEGKMTKAGAMTGQEFAANLFDSRHENVRETRLAFVLSLHDVEAAKTMHDQMVRRRNSLKNYAVTPKFREMQPANVWEI